MSSAMQLHKRAQEKEQQEKKELSEQKAAMHGNVMKQKFANATKISGEERTMYISELELALDADNGPMQRRWSSKTLMSYLAHKLKMNDSLTKLQAEYTEAKFSGKVGSEKPITFKARVALLQRNADAYAKFKSSKDSNASAGVLITILTCTNVLC